jgi:pimeloyl-ACP methyl ester carboxylesterase
MIMKNAETMIRTDDYGTFKSVIKEIRIGQETWRYSVSGNGKKHLLALMINVAGHVFALPLAETVHEHYVVIALSVPPLPRFALSGEGLAAILRHEDVRCCDAIGHSNGGVHIQNLIRHDPNVVNKVIFSHSLTSLSQNDVHTVNDTEARFYRLAKAVMKVMPLSVLVNALGGKMMKKLKLESSEKYTEAMRALCREELNLLTKVDLLGIIRCMEDFLQNHTFQNDWYRARPGKVLLLNSPTDKLVNPRQKEAMRKLCPGAREYQFSRGGHTPMVEYPEEYFRVVKEFLISDSLQEALS